MALVVYPLTRFAYSVKMVENVTRNKKVLRDIPEDPTFPLARKKQVVKMRKEFEKFEGHVADKVFWQKGAAVIALMQPLSAVLHFLEGDKIPLSFIIPLYSVYYFYTQRLPEKVTANLRRTTIRDVQDKVKERWLGTARKVGLRAPVHCLAFMLDPYVYFSVKVVLGTEGLNTIKESFSDDVCEEAILNYCGEKRNDKYAVLVGEFERYRAAFNSDCDGTNPHRKLIVRCETLVETQLKTHIASCDEVTKGNKVNLLISCLKKLATIGSAKVFYNRVAEPFPMGHSLKIFSLMALHIIALVGHACSVERINKNMDMIMNKVSTT